MVDPYLFGVNSIGERKPLIFLVFFSTAVIPAFGTFLIVRLGLAKSFVMDDKMDRTGPLIISGVFYLWVFWNLYSNPDMPRIFTTLMLGATIGLFLVFFFNIFFKISAHMTGMGGWIGGVFLLVFFQKYQYLLLEWGEGMRLSISLFSLLAISIVIAGLVASSRLWLKAHNFKELGYGMVGGVASQFMAYTILF